MRRIYFLILRYPDCDVGAMKYQSFVFEYFRKKRDYVYVFGNSKIQTRYMLNRFFRLFFGMFHTLRIPRGSVLVMNNSFFFEYFVPLIVNKFWKKHVYFLIIHDLVQGSRSTYMRRKLENYFIRNTYGITISEAMKKELIDLKLKSSDIEVVSPGLDVRLENIPQKKVFPDIPQLLYVGSIERRKGIIYLIEALKFLSSEQFMLNLVGRIAQLDYSVKLKKIIHELDIQDKVCFRGRVSQHELEKFYLNSTIFVFSSLYEGYGMVIAEAMAYGLPIVASRIPTTLELVEDGVEGILVEPKNPEELGRTVKKLLNDKNRLELLSSNAQKKAKTYPTWETTLEKIWRIVNGLEKN